MWVEYKVTVTMGNATIMLDLGQAPDSGSTLAEDAHPRVGAA